MENALQRFRTYLSVIQFCQRTCIEKKSRHLAIFTRRDHGVGKGTGDRRQGPTNFFEADRVVGRSLPFLRRKVTRYILPAGGQIPDGHRDAHNPAVGVDGRYAGLITAAHAPLAAPVTLIWDNLNTHISAAMCEWIGARADWLTVERLPACAPELNAAPGNLAARDVDQFTAIVKNRLKSIQYRPTLIEGFLAQTGLTFELEPP